MTPLLDMLAAKARTVKMLVSYYVEDKNMTGEKRTALQSKWADGGFNCFFTGKLYESC